MSVRTGQSITKIFSTRVFSTGVATNADSTPTGTLYVNGTADAASVTVTNITTGLYKAAVTLPTLAVGDIVDLRIAATVSSVTDTEVIWSDTKDLVIDSAGLADATTVKVGPSGSGTAQTARDIGASVLLSSGTGTGQLDFTSGVVKSNATQIAGSAVSTTSAQIGVNVVNVGGTAQTAGDIYSYLTTNLGLLGANLSAIPKTGFKLASDGLAAITAWTVAITGNITGNLSGSIGSYTGNTPQTGDAYARLGAPAGASTAADIAAINAKTTNLPASPASTTNITSATGVTLASSQTFTNTSSSNQTGDAFARIGAAGAGLTSLGDTRLVNLDAAVSTRLATSGYTAPDNTGIASAASSASSAASSASTAATQATNAATQTTAGNIRAAVGMSAANLDTQIGDLPTNAELTTAITALLTTQMTEAYAADGTAPTLAQCLFLIQQSLHEFSISGTARTVKKLDGSTTAAVFTLDSATSPTSTTRTT